MVIQIGKEVKLPQYEDDESLYIENVKDNQLLLEPINKYNRCLGNKPIYKNQ
jgi:hypothetical protein